MEILLQVILSSLKWMTSVEYVSCKLTFRDIWSPIDKQINSYINVGHMVTSWLVMDISLKVTPCFLCSWWLLVNACLVKEGDIWSSYWLTNYYIDLEPKVTSLLFMEIPHQVTPGLPTVDDFFESLFCKMTLGDPWSPLLINKILTTKIDYQRWTLVFLQWMASREYLSCEMT